MILGMTNFQAALIAAVVGAIIVGQVLFKLSSQQLVLGSGIPQFFYSLLNAKFILAITFYFLGTLLWVVLLQSVPLSKAYPFMALSFALIPIISHYLFQEPLSARYLSGLTIYIAGLYLIATA